MPLKWCITCVCVTIYKGNSTNYLKMQTQWHKTAKWYLLLTDFKNLKKILLVGIFSFWKQFWIQLENAFKMIYYMCVCDNFQMKQYKLSKNSDATTQKRQNCTPHLQIKNLKKILLVGIFTFWIQFWIQLGKTFKLMYYMCVCVTIYKGNNTKYLKIQTQSHKTQNNTSYLQILKISKKYF